jgi:hypothetical protein
MKRRITSSSSTQPELKDTMKNLKTSTDFEIYRMRELITLFNLTRFKNNHTKKMEKELNSEYKKRNIIASLAWDLFRNCGPI